MTLDEFVAEVCERLRADMQSIRSPDGDIHPALFYNFEGESIRRFKIPRGWFEDRRSKDVMTRAIEQATSMIRPRFLAFETTVWKIDQYQRDEMGGSIMPSEHPDRREAVMIIAFSRTEFRYVEATITRDGRNPPVYGELVELPDLERMAGAVYEPLQRAMQG